MSLWNFMSLYGLLAPIAWREPNCETCPACTTIFVTYSTSLQFGLSRVGAADEMFTQGHQAEFPSWMLACKRRQCLVLGRSSRVLVLVFQRAEVTKHGVGAHITVV